MTEKAGERKLGDLETIHDQELNPDADKIKDLSDDELKEAISNPGDGQRIKVRGRKGNRVLDGNTRIHEEKKRFKGDMIIEVEELPEDEEFPNL